MHTLMSVLQVRVGESNRQLRVLNVRIMSLAMDVDLVTLVKVAKERLEHDFVVFEVEGGKWLLVQVRIRVAPATDMPVYMSRVRNCQDIHPSGIVSFAA